MQKANNIRVHVHLELDAIPLALICQWRMADNVIEFCVVLSMTIYKRMAQCIWKKPQMFNMFQS